MTASHRPTHSLWLMLAAGLFCALAIALVAWVVSRPPIPADPPPERPDPPVVITPAPVAPPPTFAPKPPPDEKFIGFAISAYDHPRPEAFFEGIDQMHELGFNSVELIVPVFATHAGSRTVQMAMGRDRSLDLNQIVAILQHAASRGMHTTLMPVVVLTSPRPGEWTGTIEPPDWDAWWLSYRQVIDTMIDLGKQADVDALCIGAELLSTERQTQRWVDLIAYVRTRFDGYLLYCANWDSYEVPGFWSHLDFIGVNGFWDLTQPTDTREPDVDVLTERWIEIRDDLLEFADERERPVLLTKIGYPSVPWALARPWNYIARHNQEADVATQARAYAAFLQAWSGLLTKRATTASSPSPLVGVFFYEWDLTRTGDPADTGYGVRGKPALELLRAWLDQR